MKIGVMQLPTPAAMPTNSLGRLVRPGDVLEDEQYTPSNEEWSIPRGNGHQQSTECSEHSTDTECATPSATIHDHVRSTAADQPSDTEDRGESGELSISHSDAIWEP